jgi:hypothetical protein
MTSPIFIRYPYVVGENDDILKNIKNGIRTRKITNVDSYDARLSFLERQEAKRRINNIENPRETIVLMSYTIDTISPSFPFTISIGVDSKYNESLAEWNDVYRISTDIIEARKSKNYQKSDELKRSIQEYYVGSQIRFTKDVVIITNAE